MTLSHQVALCWLGWGCRSNALWSSDPPPPPPVAAGRCGVELGTVCVSRSEEFWPWMSHVLLPYVHGNQSSPELGPPRLRQVRLQEGELRGGPGTASLPCVPCLLGHRDLCLLGCRGVWGGSCRAGEQRPLCFQHCAQTLLAHVCTRVRQPRAPSAPATTASAGAVLPATALRRGPTPRQTCWGERRREGPAIREAGGGGSPASCASRLLPGLGPGSDAVPPPAGSGPGATAQCTTAAATCRS